MTVLRRILALLALLSVLFSVSCGGGDRIEETTAETDAATDPLTHLAIVDAGTVRYTIIYPADCSNALRALSTSFEYSFRALASDGVFPRKTDGTEETVREVLIGETNRKESRAVYRELRESGKEGFIVRAVGEKLVFAGTSVEMLERAYSYFAMAYMIHNETSTLSVPVTEYHIEYPAETVLLPETTAEP